MTRKEFLKYAALVTAGMSLSDKLRITASLEAASLAPHGRTLINVLLEGGPDFLHLFVPKPDSTTTSYGYKYWNNRTQTTSRGTVTGNFTSWNNAYTRDYEEITLNGQTFGVLKGDAAANVSYNGWLISQLRAGKVAILCNVKHSTSRDHSNSLMVAQTGLYASNPLQTSVAGWGGQLINVLDNTANGNARLLSMSNPIRQFCSTSSTNNNKAVSFVDSRTFGLTRSSDIGNTEGNTDLRFKRARALKTYLQARRADTTWNTNNPVLRKFTEQHNKLLTLTDSVKSVLSTTNPQPTAIANLYARSNGTLQNATFGRQIANLYDALQVPALNMRIASLAYGGWDSHKNQKTDIEPQFNDLFGTGKAFDTLFNQTGGSTVFGSSVILIYGEFGRQLKANGDGGTDHGRGNYVILIGDNVNGGIYGTMFAEKDKDNFDNPNRDIDTTRDGAFTSFDPIYNRVASWLNDGTMSSVSLSLNGETTKIDTSGGLNLGSSPLIKS